MSFISVFDNSISATAIGATQAIPDNVVTFVNFNAVVFDRGGLFNIGTPTRLTARVNGVYAAMTNLAFAANAIGIRDWGIRVNGGLYVAAARQNAAIVGAGDQTQMSGGTVIALNAGDYIEVSVRQTSGAALNLEAGANFSPTLSLGYSGR